MNDLINELGEVTSSRYKNLVKNAKNKSKEIIEKIKKGNTVAHGNVLIHYVTVPILNDLVFLRFLENIIKKGGDSNQYWSFKLSYYDETSRSSSSECSEFLNEVINENVRLLCNQILMNKATKEKLNDDLINYICTFLGKFVGVNLPVHNDTFQLVKKDDDFLYVNESKLMVSFNQDFRGGRKKRKTRIKRKRNKKRKTNKNRFV